MKVSVTTMMASWLRRRGPTVPAASEDLFSVASNAATNPANKDKMSEKYVDNDDSMSPCTRISPQNLVHVIELSHLCLNRQHGREQK